MKFELNKALESKDLLPCQCHKDPVNTGKYTMMSLLLSDGRFRRLKSTFSIDIISSVTGGMVNSVTNANHPVDKRLGHHAPVIILKQYYHVRY